MKQGHVIFPCGNIKLEGIFFEAEGKKQVPAVVICHPHPLYGGSMHNNVTCAIAESLTAKAISALLFNFRGVGRSEGQHGGGVVEQQDIGAALDWMQAQSAIVPMKLGLAGYSFGAAVALPVACADERVKGVALVSPYFDSSHGDLLENCKIPKLIVNGSQDYLVSPEAVTTYMSGAAEPKKHVLIEGADHFWGGYEDEMVSEVVDFFADLFR